MFRKILVAADGSEPSERAVGYAVELAKKGNSKLIILSVIPSILLPILHRKTFVEDVKEKYQNVLNNTLLRVRRESPELRIESLLEEGRPSATIVDVAEREDVGMIVMGSRGIGGVKGWILGSTSRIVAESCMKPVLIVK